MRSRSSPLLTSRLPPPRSLLRLTPAASKELLCRGLGLGSCPELAATLSSHSTANLGQTKDYFKEWLKRGDPPSHFGAAALCQTLCWVSHHQTPDIKTQRQNSVVQVQLMPAGLGPNSRLAMF